MPGKDSFQEQGPVEIDVDEFLETRHDPAVHSPLAESQAETDAPEFSDGRPVIPLEATILIGGFPLAVDRRP
jgi:hypothetical protein